MPIVKEFGDKKREFLHYLPQSRRLDLAADEREVRVHIK